MITAHHPLTVVGPGAVCTPNHRVQRAPHLSHGGACIRRSLDRRAFAEE